MHYRMTICSCNKCGIKKYVINVVPMNNIIIENYILKNRELIVIICISNVWCIILMLQEVLFLFKFKQHNMIFLAIF
jgi:hypothetical protein